MAKNKKTEQTQEEEIPEIESDADETARDDSDAMGDLLAKLSELKKAGGQRKIASGRYDKCCDSA